MTDHPEGGSCDLPEVSTLRTELAHRRFDRATFSWEGVAAQVYKRGDAGETGLGWRDVVRHTLAGGDALKFQLRYFEIGPDGYSSLEKHLHAHTIVVLRGRGRVVAGPEVFAVEPFDLVVIPPGTPHQFLNAGAEPFGFLCPVDADRDAPKAISPDEVEALLADPVVREAVRIADPVGGRG
ncbi:MAG TPA: cupin domain-containing protein [bacterium]|nr:cupin domain-containing protein [bacterium]